MAKSVCMAGADRRPLNNVYTTPISNTLKRYFEPGTKCRQQQRSSFSFVLRDGFIG